METYEIKDILPGAIVRLPSGQLVGVCGKTGEKGGRQMMCLALESGGNVPLNTPVELVHSAPQLMRAMLRAEAKRTTKREAKASE